MKLLNPLPHEFYLKRDGMKARSSRGNWSIYLQYLSFGNKWELNTIKRGERESERRVFNTLDAAEEAFRREKAILEAMDAMELGPL